MLRQKLIINIWLLHLVGLLSSYFAHNARSQEPNALLLFFLLSTCISPNLVTVLDLGLYIQNFHSSCMFKFCYGILFHSFLNCAHTNLFCCVLLTYLLTHSMVQSPSWAADWFAASQEIPRISRNPKVHCRTHKRPPPVSILGQPNPVHIPTSHLLEIHPNIIHPLRLGLPSGLLPSGFPSKTLYTPLSLPTRATWPIITPTTRNIIGNNNNHQTYPAKGKQPMKGTT